MKELSSTDRLTPVIRELLSDPAYGHVHPGTPPEHAHNFRLVRAPRVIRSRRRREFCRSADALSPSLLIHLLNAEGGAAVGETVI